MEKENVYGMCLLLLYIPYQMAIHPLQSEAQRHFLHSCICPEIFLKLYLFSDGVVEFLQAKSWRLSVASATPFVVPSLCRM